ncbi:MAG: hypothetical protein HC831_07750, partial [Chloroflexia bacterium]|nr:hypothetical protein [Chloroflexia bacterium]
MGYNHEAKPPLYWETKTIYAFVSLDGSTTIYPALFNGDMLPTENLSGSDPAYLQLTDFSANDLLGVRVKIDGVYVTGVIGWSDLENNGLAVPLDDSVGTKVLTVEYWKRATGVSSYIKATDNIEDGSITLIVSRAQSNLSFTTATLVNTYKDVYGDGPYLIDNFDVNFQFLNYGTLSITK